MLWKEGWFDLWPLIAEHLELYFRRGASLVSVITSGYRQLVMLECPDPGSSRSVFENRAASETVLTSAITVSNTSSSYPWAPFPFFLFFAHWHIQPWSSADSSSNDLQRSCPHFPRRLNWADPPQLLAGSPNLTQHGPGLKVTELRWRPRNASDGVSHLLRTAVEKVTLKDRKLPGDKPQK